jgi:hypothetical protein
VKFKTTISSTHASVEHPSTSNTLDESANKGRRRQTSSDYTTEVSLFNSKTDSCALTINDETTQTATIESGSVNIDTTSTGLQRHTQRQSHSTVDDESTELLLSTRTRSISNHHLHPSPTIKPTSSSLVIAAENPWKKLSNVRYKLDETEEKSPDDNQQCRPVYAQHITFV